MVIRVGTDRWQIEIDLKKDYQDVFKNDKHFNSKRIIDARNEFTDLK